MICSLFFVLLLPTLYAPHYAFAKSAEGTARPLPEFITKYAPLVWLMSEETYFPSDIATHIANSVPLLNNTIIQSFQAPLNLFNIHAQLGVGDKDIFLTIKDNVTTRPAWLEGTRPGLQAVTVGATNCAVIVYDHGGGLVDAFFMYFYSYNWGGRYLRNSVGDHIGDWEHTMIRFQDQEPQSIWYSQHNFGQAFSYQAVEKQDLRPIVYSANGSHANYATAGTHDHTIPGKNLQLGFLKDYTDKGTLWDPMMSSYAYEYTLFDNVPSFTPYDWSSGQSTAVTTLETYPDSGTTTEVHIPTSWLSFKGHWGDEKYDDDDPRQHEILGFDFAAHYVSGPIGPVDKQLNRTEVCPASRLRSCRIRTTLETT